MCDSCCEILAQSGVIILLKEQGNYMVLLYQETLEATVSMIRSSDSWS